MFECRNLKRLSLIIFLLFHVNKSDFNCKLISFVGSFSSRFLHIRLLEHARSIKNYIANSTALAQPAHTFKHTFDFKEVKILEYEQNLKKRLCLEMIHIKKKIIQLTLEQILKI